MRMTPAEFELLGGMQAWADRNADAIGKALAEHTFTAGPAGGFLREYAEGKGIARRRPQEGLGLRPGRPLQGHLQGGRQARAASASKYFEGLLGVGALHTKINLPLKWFLGTYPVFAGPRPRGMLADVPEPARIEKKFLGRSSKSVDFEVLPAAERALSRIFNYDSQAIVEAFYYDTFAVDGREPADDGRGRPRPRHLRPLRHRAQQDARDAADLRRLDLEVQDMCSSMNVRLSETGQAINELAESASRVAEGAARQADVASQGRNAVEQATNAANGATDLSRTGIEAAMGATAALNDARERIEEAATAITALAGRSAQVGGIVDAIQDIARQTNLLALNAAIEAARAGERGKGFAVVADEVRQLAERAAQSAADAGDLIAGIQGETDAAVELVRDAASRTHAGTEASGSARTTLEEIDGSIGLITRRARRHEQADADIATYAEETAASARADVGHDAADERLHAGDRRLRRAALLALRAPLRAHRAARPRPLNPRTSQAAFERSTAHASGEAWAGRLGCVIRTGAGLGVQLGEDAGQVSEMSSSRRVPSAAKASSAMPIGSSRSITRAPIAARTLRASAWAQTAPNRPVEAPTTAAGLLRSGRLDQGAGEPVEGVLELARDRVVVLGGGDEHGVGVGDRVEQRLDRVGRACSSSSSKGGISLSPSNSTSSASPGSRSPAARRSLELWEPARRLPERPRTFIGLRRGQLELDEQLDLVGQREAALGQRRVPVEAVLGAVDDRLELDADLLDVAEGHVRLGDRAAGLDRARVALDRELAVDDQRRRPRRGSASRRR